LTRVEAPNRWTASIHEGSPVRTWVYLRSEGLKENLQGDDMTIDGNVHHWAWGVALGADFGSQGSYINTAREITQFNGNWNNTSGDIKIGNLGVEYGWHLTSNDLSVDQVPKIFNRYIHYPY